MFGLERLRSKRLRTRRDSSPSDPSTTGAGGARARIAIVETIARSIVVPVAFDDGTHEVLSLALTLAARFGGAVHVVHAVEAPITATPEVAVATVGNGVVEEVLAAAGDRVASLVEQYRRAAECLLDGVVRVGPAPNVIIDAVTEFGADMIVMPTHARSGVRRALVGSVADRVLRVATVPVLIVPPRA